MKRWGRATRNVFCGYCRLREIPKGDPVLYVKTSAMTREMRRCVDCSGPAPPDLPPLIEQKAPGDFSMTHVASSRPKTRGDLKAAVKEWLPYREPGEDDE